MQKHEGILFLARARAPATSNAVAWSKEPQDQIYSSIYNFRTKTGSWQGLIGCRGFLVFTNWLFAAGGCILCPDKLKPVTGSMLIRQALASAGMTSLGNDSAFPVSPTLVTEAYQGVC